MSFVSLLPEIIICLTALLLILADLPVAASLKDRSSRLAFITATGMTISLAVLLGLFFGGYHGIEGDFFGSFRADTFAFFLRAALLLSGILTTMLSLSYVKKYLRHPGEFYALISLATLGALFLVSATEMLTLYLSLELLSISSFVLVTLRKDQARSAEAGMKYLIFGAVSSGFLLFGLSLLFGLTGSLNYATISSFLQDGQNEHLILATKQIGEMAINVPSLQMVITVLFILGGLAYKIAAVPFHLWAPDVYQGAPTPVTAFLSSSSKLAGFAALLRVLEMLNASALIPLWSTVVFAMAVLSMTLGNIMALAQKDVKRLFAYSSIAHAGYLLMGVGAFSSLQARELALKGLLYYLLVYVFMNLGAFAVITYWTSEVDRTDIESFAGLSQRSPWLAFVLSVCLLSLTGLPPFAGFSGKFYLFGAVSTMGAGYLGLVLWGALNSVVSLYYYSRLIRVMYFSAPEESQSVQPADPLTLLVSAIGFVGVLGLFIFPAPVLKFISQIGQLV